MSNKVIYKFYWDCGRVGDIDGLFIATEEEVTAQIGEEVYFGEVLGKHSEIYGTLNAEDLTVVSDIQSEVEVVSWVFAGATTLAGYNPLEYMEDVEDEDL